MSLEVRNAWEASLEKESEAKAAWHLTRRAGLGGSEIGIIMGLSPYKTAFQLCQEKLGLALASDISHLPHVRRGILGETECRALLEEKYATTYVPTMWNKGEVLRCTDDGYSSALNQILEIKCMGADAHLEVRDGKIPETYRLQCQWNMYVSGAASCLFVSFRPEDKTMHELLLHPDHDEQETLAEFALMWWQKYIVDRVEHPRSSADYKTVRDAGFTEAAKAYRLLKERHDQDTKDLERLKDIMSKHLNDATPAITGGGVRMSKTFRKGNIEYGKIEALRHINLEEYRKEGSWVTTVRIDTAP